MAKKKSKKKLPATSGEFPRGQRKQGVRAAKTVTKVGIERVLKDFCRTLPGTTEDVKWEDNLIFSVGGKMYAGFDIEKKDNFAFKCDDVDFERLTKIDGIIPAPYAARFGWVAFRRAGALPLDKTKALIRKSHGLVAACLPKKTRAVLGLA